MFTWVFVHPVDSLIHEAGSLKRSQVTRHPWKWRRGEAAGNRETNFRSLDGPMMDFTEFVMYFYTVIAC